ncbi:hypothetical protein [Yoonia vestfoldensis]|uniref:hypothetical protein n=1 Tax=Yoonia vestfoldensis TaxID=245188 RepID=UPI0003759EBD|nr:hypothetical protein [Yoonia vestfoldensis]
MDLIETLGHGSRDELHARLQAQLGLDAPVSDRALAAVMTSHWFAQKLMAVRQSPEALRHLLANPPAAPVSVLDHFGRKGRDDRDADGSGHADHSLGRSALTWLRNGLRNVDDETRARRWEACMQCPHQRDSAPGPLHKMTAAVVRSTKTCGLCGCNLRAKTAVPHERCPDENPAHPGLTRWSDPIIHQPKET